MKISCRLFSVSKNLDSLFAAFIGFFLIQIYTRHSGIGISPDSVTYLSGSRNLLHGMGYKAFDRLPTVDFPIGYPLFLTVISFFSRLDPLQFSPWLNGLLFGLLIYLSGGIMNGFTKPSGWYKRIILLCLLLSPALQEVYSMLWSETVFILLTLLFVFAIAKYLQQNVMRWLLISAFICAIACITRYAGVFLVLTGSMLLISSRDNGWKKRIQQTVVFGSISISFLLVNIIRNNLLGGTATGARPISHTGIIKILEYFGGVICDWLLLPRYPGLSIILAMAVLIVFLLTIAVSLSRKRSGGTLEYVISMTGLFYCLFMLLSYRIIRYEQYTSRLLAPAFIPLIWSSSAWLPNFLSTCSFRIKGVIGLVALWITASFLNIQLRADYEFFDGVKDAGVPGYLEDPFTQSEIVQYIKQNKTLFDSGTQVYSNAADAFYFITDLNAYQLPHVDFPNTVLDYYARKNNYLVWFYDIETPDIPDLDTILKNKNLVPLKEFKDGTIYISR